MSFRTSLSILAILAGSSAAIAEPGPCDGFRWDVTAERALFEAGPQRHLSTGATAAAAPALEVGELFELQLMPQEDVQLAAAPSKTMLADGTHAGSFSLRLAHAGEHRIALDSGAWIDVVLDGQALASAEFSGSAGCRSPRKVVVYALPAEQDLIVQFSASEPEKLRVSVTPHRRPD